MTDQTALATREAQTLALSESGNIVDLYIASLRKPQSRRTMIQALARVTDLLADRQPAESEAENWTRARAFKWEGLRAGHVEIIKARLGESMAEATANKLLSAIRGVTNAARIHKRMAAEDCQDIKAVKLFPAHTTLRGRALSADELELLAEVCREDKTIAGRRDAALMSVGYGAGLRRFEMASLLVRNWSKEERCLTIESGKGGKPRTVFLSPSGARALDRWLDVRQAPGPDAALFVPINKGGRIIERRITDQSIYDIFDKRWKEAALRGSVARFSPHDLRRTNISDLLDAGADISAVAAQAGHSSVDTTRRYDRRGDRAKKQAADRLKVPF